MKETLKPVTALLISVAILLTGSGLQGTLLPIRASLESFSTISIGFIGAAALNALGRNPEKLSDIRTLMITAIVFADALAIIGIIVAFIARA